MADLKQTFILKETQRYLTEVIEVQKIVMKREGIGVTDDLLNSFASQVRPSGAGAVGELIFKEYGRMIDMGAGRAHPLGGLAQTTVVLQASKTKGLAFVKDKVRKPKKFYSRVVYGKLIYLKNRLLHGYTEETIKMLKKEIST